MSEHKRVAASFLARTTACLAEKESCAASEAKGGQVMDHNTVDPNSHSRDTSGEQAFDRIMAYAKDCQKQEEQQLDCIYDDSPLGFEDLTAQPNLKLEAHDPLDEVDLGEGTKKRPTFFSRYVQGAFRENLIGILKETRIVLHGTMTRCLVYIGALWSTTYPFILGGN